MSRSTLCAVQFAAAAAFAFAWDTPPHRTITKAAVDSLPASVSARLGAEKAKLIDLYCILPDRYVEMEQHGFARKGPGPKTAEELRPYCRRPDGQMVHSATFDRDEDLNSVIFLIERILTGFNKKQLEEAAMFTGVLAHFIEDSLSPPHSVLAEDLQEIGPGIPNLHRALEQSVADFAIERRTEKRTANLLAGLESILDRIYAGADRNRKALPEMARAVRAGDAATVESHRARAGRDAAEILADALVLLLSFPDR